MSKETRFEEWQRRQGWTDVPLKVVSAHLEGQALRLSVRGATPEGGEKALEAFADELSQRWNRTVSFSLESRDLGTLIPETIGRTQAALGALLREHPIKVEDGRVTIRFKSPFAKTLFEKWGGQTRLVKEIPEMANQELIIATDEIAPPVPDAPVAVDIRSLGDSGQKLGRTIDPERVVPLDQLPESGEVAVAGRIILRDVRESRDGSRHWTWTISDDLGAVRLKWSERRGAPKVNDDFWPQGSWLLAQGVLEVDKFTEERVIRVKDGALAEAPPLFVPDARPRIELHAHSKMSAMDGLIAPKDLFQAAQALKMEAVAILDHGVVQTYPEAEALSAKTGVRALYGVEAYMVDTEVRPFTGPMPEDWRHRPLVVVDVETTGLTPWVHEVIELGAVKVVDGAIVDVFHRLVKPSRAISAATTRITGIREEELAEGVSADALWRDFFAFSEGALLAAHNARFDMGFLSQGHRLLFPEKPFQPAVLDTLALARAVLPGLKSYGLGPLSDYYKIPLSQHHRALADAEATGHLAMRLMKDLDEKFPEFQPSDVLPVSHTVGRPVPVTLLVKNQEGVAALYRLVSESHLTFFHRTPRIPRRLIQEGRQHWLVGSPFHDGEVAEAFFRNASPEDMKLLASFYDYWEVAAPSSAQSFLNEEFFGEMTALQDFIQAQVAFGRAHQRPVVAVSDAHYLKAAHRVYRDILAATAKGEMHNREDALHLRTAQELEDELAFLSDADREWVIYEAPAAVVQSLEPVQPVPTGLFSPKLPEAETVVSEEPFRRARELYGDPLPEIIQARLAKEVNAIVSNGFSSIYYIAHRLVQKSLEDGYLVGSRGSVGSSLVATFLNITEVNPLPPHYRCPSCRHTEFVTDGSVGAGFDLPAKQCPACGTRLIGDGQDIPFETFLGFEGDKVPDIDLNFSGDYQPEIHRYTEVLFGEGHVFRAGTIATVAEKTAFGLVKGWARETGRDPSPAVVDWLAQGIVGVKRTTGQHPGGLMVVPSDEDIHHFTPVQRPADDKTSDVVTTHFDYHSIEGRLLKLDLLGHDDPTAIRMLEDLTGISAKSVPFQDEKTMSLFHDVSALGVKAEDIGTPVGSLGIPEFGTRFVRQMLMDTRPRTFAELVRISGLSHGTEVWTNNAQELIRQKVATLSDVIATRDDIMTYLLSRGIKPKVAFSISEAVRKGKGLKEDQEAVMREHGVPTWYIESCRRISYLFPKAHAAAYVTMGWRIAWFKVHHPLAYYATYFSVRAGDFDAETVLGGIKRVNQTLAAIDDKGNEASAKEKNLVTVLEIAREMLARGFRFYPIDLERSHATRFLMESDGLLIPFAALPGLGVNAAQHIIRARQEQPFLSIDDLRQRARLSKSIVELLRGHGALKNLGETSQLGFF
ncbi:PolC-type DNA polymerase III [Sulfobacillus sp. DSM 109850]|uniref:DNA polymerase III PolC-type n=1 Tax=Sulfobacillus harzensis TaxID=2729629 RepID=A0A7Y0Q1V1_9FIRM|nr:PolC-type DNA polymerase III [Sulfobacillus harzensis]NMP21827.1 PolC-type DNA polymerase III [Sulfobacillus harzensis]